MDAKQRELRHEWAAEPRAALAGYDPWKTGLTVLLAFYLSAYLRDPYAYLLLDHIDLAIHEAGHLLLQPLGELVWVAGGTLLQVAVPLAFFAHFLRRGDRFAVGILLLWVAQSLFNVALYAADARAQELPLLGGSGVIHDWNYLLSRVGLLEHDRLVGGVLRGLALMLFVVGFGTAMAASRRPAEA